MIHGIDLSRYQEGPNDFGELRRGGYDFAVTRWGVGTYRDPTRVTNLLAIHDAGLIPGAYLVPGENTGSGAQQANNFVAEVRGAVGDMPVLFTMDAEHSNSFGDPSAALCADFVATVHSLTGQTPLGYVPKWWMDGQGWTTAQVSAVAAHALWWQSRYDQTPDFDNPPDANGYKGWPLKLWQWTSSGSAPGIPGTCDLDVFYGTKKELLALAGASPLEDDLQADERAWLADMHHGNYRDAGGDLTWLDEKLADIIERVQQMHSGNFLPSGDLTWLDKKLKPILDRLAAIEGALSSGTPLPPPATEMQGTFTGAVTLSTAAAVPDA